MRTCQGRQWPLTPAKHLPTDSPLLSEPELWPAVPTTATGGVALPSTTLLAARFRVQGGSPAEPFRALQSRQAVWAGQRLALPAWREPKGSG